MNKTVSFLIRLALPVGALALLMALPMTDSIFGGRRVEGTRPVYSNPGDADGDGFLTLDDADAIRAMARGAEAYSNERLKVSDLNADGQITAEDAGILLKYLADRPAGMTPDVYFQSLRGGAQTGTEGTS